MLWTIHSIWSWAKTLIENTSHRWRVLIAAVLLSAGLGSIHGFSVFLGPLELRFGVARGAIAFAYSLGLASLTLAVLIGHRFYNRLSPSILVASTVILAALGLAMAAFAPHVFALWLGFGLIFGFANGVGYGFALHVTNHAFDHHRGLAMGSVTAVYALGASVFATLFDGWITEVGAEGALLRLLLILLILGAISSACLWGQGQDKPQADGGTVEKKGIDRRKLMLCWLTYGTAVAAGLMAMGHAAGIVEAIGGDASDGVRGAVAITFANALGGFTAGYVADRQPVEKLLIGLGLLSAMALMLLALTSDVALVIGGLAVIGFTYGAIIAVFPFATALIFGRAHYARAYGRIFTSWGLAGLLGPWFAGVLFSRTGSYGTPLLVAAFLACVSIAASFLLARRSAT